MTDSDLQLEPPRPPLFVQRSVWGALLASQGLYFGIAAAGLVSPEREHVTPPPLLIFAGVAASMVVLSFLVPRSLHRSALARETFATEEVVDPDAPVTLRRAAPTIRRYVDPVEARTRALRLAQTPLVLAVALIEVVATMGLTATILGHPVTLTAPFFLVAMALTASRFPTERRALAAVEAHTGVPFPAPRR